MSFLHTDMAQVVDMWAMRDKNVPILHSQYYGCWCYGDSRKQAISNHDIYYVKPN